MDKLEIGSRDVLQDFIPMQFRVERNVEGVPLYSSMFENGVAPKIGDVIYPVVYEAKEDEHGVSVNCMWRVHSVGREISNDKS